jgi:hypothetical protein
MQVIEAQCASILVPHDHLHINQYRAPLDEHGYRREGFAGEAVSPGGGQQAWDCGSQRGDRRTSMRRPGRGWPGDRLYRSGLGLAGPSGYSCRGQW